MIAELETLSPKILQERLSSALGTTFLFWQSSGTSWYSGDTPRIASGELSAWFTHLIQTTNANSHSPPVFVTKRLADQIWTAAVLVASDDSTGREPWVVIAGQVPSDPIRLAQHAIEQCVKSSLIDFNRNQQQSLIDSYAVQSLSNYEELSFLRQISRYVEYCDASRSLGDVASTLIPALRQLIGAEGVAFIEAATTEPRPVDTSMVGTPGQRRPVIDDGTLPFSADSWRDFVAGIQSLNHDGPLVWNANAHLGNSRIASLPESVTSYILIPIRKEGETFGWLLAVNKCDLGAVLGMPPSNSLGYDEFGSIEASLMQATASLFSTHGLNSRRFRDLENLIVDVVYTLVNVIEAKDEYTLGHSDRVAAIAKTLAMELGLPQKACEEIFLSGLLHDIGKVGVADEILRKPGKLTTEEFDQIKRHPEIGYRLLQGLKPFQNLLPGVLSHHEAVDGSGYPHGLVGEDIPLMARVIAVADAYDAMTSDRPYRAGMPTERAEEILCLGAGKTWDAEVVEAYFGARNEVVQICRNWRLSREKAGANLAEQPGTQLDPSKTLQRSVEKWRNRSTT